MSGHCPWNCGRAGALVLGCWGLIVLAACSETAHEGDAPRNAADQFPIVRPDVQTFQLRRTDESLRTASARSLLNRLASYQRLATVGALEEPAEQIFGKIEDVVVAEGRVYILDSQANNVRGFDRNGELVIQGGRSGEGPGEFLHPLSLEVDRTGTVYVGELEHTIEVFTPVGSELKPDHQLQVDVAAHDMCAAGDELIVHGWDMDRNTVLHRFSMAGHREADFASFLSPEYNPLLISQLSVGKIACVPDDDQVVVVPHGTIPEVRAYSFGATPRWLDEIEHYVPTDIETSGPSYSVRIPDEGFNRLYSITRPWADHLLLQISFITRDDNRERKPFTELHSYAIEVDSGRGEYLGTGVPPIVAAQPDECYVSSPSGPLPRLSLHCRN